MPFNELQRTGSWPPTILRINSNEPATPPEVIDENPFSFFLTEPEDYDDIDDFFEDEYLSAGIDDGKRDEAVREVSPSSLERAPRSPVEDDEEDDEHYISEEDIEFGVAMPMSLKDFSKRHTESGGRKSRTGDRHLTGLGIDMPESTGRGRERVRIVPAPRGRGKTRSLSFGRRKPLSWRLPSPEIYAIEEERESDEEAKGILVSSSAPSTSLLSGSRGLATKAVSPKPKKRVHWAV